MFSLVGFHVFPIIVFDYWAQTHQAKEHLLSGSFPHDRPPLLIGDERHLLGRNVDQQSIGQPSTHNAFDFLVAGLTKSTTFNMGTECVLQRVWPMGQTTEARLVAHSR